MINNSSENGPTHIQSSITKLVVKAYIGIQYFVLRNSFCSLFFNFQAKGTFPCSYLVSISFPSLHEVDTNVFHHCYNGLTLAFNMTLLKASDIFVKVRQARPGRKPGEAIKVLQDKFV